MAIETESLNKQELSEYYRKGGLYVEQINGIRQRPFFKKQFSKSRENREGDVEMGAVGKQPIHIGYSLIDLNLGADRTEAAFACSGGVCNSIGMVGTNISGIAESFRLSMVHDLPNIVSSGKTNLRPMVREELFPLVLEKPLESEMAFADGFHNGLNSTSIPDSATNGYCPEGASCSLGMILLINNSLMMRSS